MLIHAIAVTTATEKRGGRAIFQLLSPGYELFRVSELECPFTDRENCIVRVCSGLRGLTGIKTSSHKDVLSAGKKSGLWLHFDAPSFLLVGYFKDRELLKGTPCIRNGVTIAGLPALDVYAFAYSKGNYKIEPVFTGSYVILGVIKGHPEMAGYDAMCPDGREWDPFYVEGTSPGEALLETIGGPDLPVIDEGMPGTESILGGFEGGECVKVNGTYHLFPTERAGSPSRGPYYDRVKTSVGHWTSQDAVHWSRMEPIFQASGTYAVTHDDNPVNDRRGAIWSFMPVFDPESDCWNGFYLTYTVDSLLAPNHSFGRIWHCESVNKGSDGIGGPYKDRGIVMEPGLNSQLWEGRQGVDSFFPFRNATGWYAFYGGAFPFVSWHDYPCKYRKKWWGIGLASSQKLEGPWERMDTVINPVTSIHPWFIENPLVYQLDSDVFITIFDGGPDGMNLHLPNMFGYSLSVDGIHWSKAHYIPIQHNVKKWWNIMRTPLCFIPEGNDIYTVLYAAICRDKRFHPIGLVQLKLNRNVLKNRAEELKQML